MFKLFKKVLEIVRTVAQLLLLGKELREQLKKERK